MLALPIRGHADLIAMDDDTATDRVYVALARPRVARCADGSPCFRLLRWISQSETGGQRDAGARLTREVVELSQKMLHQLGYEDNALAFEVK